MQCFEGCALFPIIWSFRWNIDHIFLALCWILCSRTSLSDEDGIAESPPSDFLQVWTVIHHNCVMSTEYKCLWMLRIDIFTDLMSVLLALIPQYQLSLCASVSSITGINYLLTSIGLIFLPSWQRHMLWQLGRWMGGTCTVDLNKHQTWRLHLLPWYKPWQAKLSNWYQIPVICSVPGYLSFYLQDKYNNATFITENICHSHQVNIIHTYIYLSMFALFLCMHV